MSVVWCCCWMATPFKLAFIVGDDCASLTRTLFISLNVFCQFLEGFKCHMNQKYWFSAFLLSISGLGSLSVLACFRIVKHELRYKSTIFLLYATILREESFTILRFFAELFNKWIERLFEGCWLSISFLLGLVLLYENTNTPYPFIFCFLSKMIIYEA